MTSAAQAPVLTRGATHRTRDSTLRRIIYDVFFLEDDDILVKAIESQGIYTVSDMIAMSQQDIENLSYTKDDGTKEGVPLARKNLVHVFQDWHLHLGSIYLHIDWDDNWDDKDVVSQEEFDLFRFTAYNPNKRLRMSTSSIAPLSPALKPPSTCSASSNIVSDQALGDIPYEDDMDIDTYGLLDTESTPDMSPVADSTSDTSSFIAVPVDCSVDCPLVLLDVDELIVKVIHYMDAVAAAWNLLIPSANVAWKQKRLVSIAHQVEMQAYHALIKDSYCDKGRDCSHLRITDWGVSYSDKGSDSIHHRITTWGVKDMKFSRLKSFPMMSHGWLNHGSWESIIVNHGSWVG